MIPLIGTLVIVMLLAIMIDHLLSEPATVGWRKATAHARARIDELDVGEATLSANRWFLGLFDAIYGAKFWSLRRVFRSIISTLLAIHLVALIIGWDGTALFWLYEVTVLFIKQQGIENIAVGSQWVILFESNDYKVFLEHNKDTLFFQYNITDSSDSWLGLEEVRLFISMIIANFFADYISLQETRLVMLLSQKSKYIGLFAWGMIDIFLTFFIYTIIYYMTPSISSSLGLEVEGFFVPITDFLELSEVIYYEISDPTFSLPFFISTFFTSVLWLAFLVSALAVRTTSRLSPRIKLVLTVIGESKTPARTVAGFVCVAILVATGIFYLANGAPY